MKIYGYLDLKIIMKELKKSCERMHIPIIPEDYFFDGLKKLISLEKDWVSNEPGSSLYIRPFVFSSSEDACCKSIKTVINF